MDYYVIHRELYMEQSVCNLHTNSII